MDATHDQYDAIFIGSGMGQMATASILARRKGWRCLLLERHYCPGGFTHVFQRHRWSWDVGIHYIGEMIEGEMLYQMMKYLTDDGLKWSKMPSDFDVFEYPDLTFRAPDNEELYRERLVDLFPSEKHSIDRYFADLRRAVSYLPAYMMSRLLPGPFGLAAQGVEKWKSRFSLQTTADYLKRQFRDERLRGLLATHWGDYGLPPQQSSFLIHSIITAHYLRGGFYPVGGGKSILDAVLPSIEKCGGGVVVNHEVQEILVDGTGKANGVRALFRQGRHAEERIFRAPVIVSGAGAANTYTRLLANPPSFARDLHSLGTSCSAVTLYLGFRESPETLGFRGENHWMVSHYDHDRIARENDPAGGKVDYAYLSFPSLKNPEAKSHTAEIICLSGYSPFAGYAGLAWKRRGEEYDGIKERMDRSIMDFVRKWHPRLEDLVEFREISTPLSVEHFTAFPSGSIYGLPATPARYRKRWLRPETPIPGLYLVGSDVSTLGIGGAVMGGLFTASSILGSATFPSVMQEAKKC